MHHILLVEDSEEIRKIVQITLNPEYQVTGVGTVVEAKNLIYGDTEFDLLLLDVVLPDGDGFELCSTLQNHPKSKNMPIIFLSGRDRVQDRVMGFSLGGDDYITKPFDPVELRARIEAKLRKAEYKKAKEEKLRKGDLLFYVPLQRVSILSSETEEGAKEAPIDLTPTEFRLLYFFANREEQVFSRDQLINSVLGRDVHRIDRTIDVHISNLRKKISTCSYLIKSVHNLGYTFIHKNKNSV